MPVVQPEGRTILVVEDDPAARATISDLLSDEGYTCVEAADGRDAIDVLSGAPAPPCAILLDLMMPRMNGWEFGEWLREQPALARVPLIVLSAAKGAGADAKRLAASAFIPKPFDLDDLLATVARYC